MTKDEGDLHAAECSVPAKAGLWLHSFRASEQREALGGFQAWEGRRPQGLTQMCSWRASLSESGTGRFGCAGQKLPRTDKTADSHPSRMVCKSRHFPLFLFTKARPTVPLPFSCFPSTMVNGRVESSENYYQFPYTDRP